MEQPNATHRKTKIYIEPSLFGNYMFLQPGGNARAAGGLQHQKPKLPDLIWRLSCRQPARDPVMLPLDWKGVFTLLKSRSDGRV